MANLSSGKAREILHHGEVKGHPLTDKQRRFMGARASGMPVRNTPLFDTPSDTEMQGIKPQEQESLTPLDSGLSSKPGEFHGRSGHGFDGTDAFSPNPSHSDKPLNDADFPNPDVFSEGTNDSFNTGGIL